MHYAWPRARTLGYATDFDGHQMVVHVPLSLEAQAADNACILCITTVAGTELADAYNPNTVIASSQGKEVHNPWSFYLHEAFLH
ncbi:hypothetical protein R6Q57_003564 [Mikania cordata]